MILKKYYKFAWQSLKTLINPCNNTSKHDREISIAAISLFGLFLISPLISTTIVSFHWGGIFFLPFPLGIIAFFIALYYPLGEATADFVYLLVFVLGAYSLHRIQGGKFSLEQVFYNFSLFWMPIYILKQIVYLSLLKSSPHAPSLLENIIIYTIYSFYIYCSFNKNNNTNRLKNTITALITACSMYFIFEIMLPFYEKIAPYL